MTGPASCGKGLASSLVVRSEAAAEQWLPWAGLGRPSFGGVRAWGANGLWACRGPRELTACEPRGSDSDGAKLTAERAGTDAVGLGGWGN